MNPATKKICTVCEYETPNKASMNLHMRKEHSDTMITEEKVVLVIDGENDDDVKKVVNETDINDHEDGNKKKEKNSFGKVTKPLKRFKCDECEFSTKNKTYLPKHKENVHSNKKENRKRGKPEKSLKSSSAISSPEPKIMKVDENVDRNKTNIEQDEDDDTILEQQLKNLKDPDNTDFRKETHHVIKMKEAKIQELIEKVKQLEVKVLDNEYNKKAVDNMKTNYSLLEKECKILKDENEKLKGNKENTETMDELPNESPAPKESDKQEYCTWTTSEAVCSFSGTKGEVEKHMKDHGIVNMKCDVCRMVFSDRATFDVHLEIGHIQTESDQENEPKFNCNKCQFQGISEDTLKTHIEVMKHHDSFQCRNCNQEFTDFPDLMMHRKADHTKKCKKFPKCDLGDECWYQHPDNPMETNETYTVVVAPGCTKFECRVCNEKFEEKPSLMKHRKLTHAATVSMCREFANNSCSRGDSKCWYRHQTNVKALSQGVQPHILVDPHQVVPQINSNVDFPQITQQQEPPGQTQTQNKDFMVQMLEMMAQMLRSMKQ